MYLPYKECINDEMNAPPEICFGHKNFTNHFLNILKRKNFGKIFGKVCKIFDLVLLNFIFYAILFSNVRKPVREFSMNDKLNLQDFLCFRRTTAMHYS